MNVFLNISEISLIYQKMKILLLFFWGGTFRFFVKINLGEQKKTRNATRSNNRDVLLHLSFDTSIFSLAYI